ncbi:unnamed protein product [Gulo gulo]|uniref:Uncharacterized protein n=1 Tax=Gulo gulo TaxID=48420 RepID=A0A9X9M6N4_GULGU|nr:unnamed protein product [Gulo gulo]
MQKPQGLELPPWRETVCRGLETDVPVPSGTVNSPSPRQNLRPQRTHWQRWLLLSAVVGLEAEAKALWVSIGRKQSAPCPVRRKPSVPSVISKCTWAGIQDGSPLPATGVPIPGPRAARRAAGRPTSSCTLGAPAGPKPAKPLPPTLTLCRGRVLELPPQRVRGSSNREMNLQRARCLPRRCQSLWARAVGLGASVSSVGSTSPAAATRWRASSLTPASSAPTPVPRAAISTPTTACMVWSPSAPALKGPIAVCPSARGPPRARSRNTERWAGTPELQECPLFCPWYHCSHFYRPPCPPSAVSKLVMPGYKTKQNIKTNNNKKKWPISLSCLIAFGSPISMRRAPVCTN